MIARFALLLALLAPVAYAAPGAELSESPRYLARLASAFVARILAADTYTAGSARPQESVRQLRSYLRR